MNNLTTNRSAYKSIWKTEETKAREIETAKNNRVYRSERAYKDPTADTALNNIMREERRNKKRATEPSQT